jgi:hypothetical protein
MSTRGVVRVVSFVFLATGLSLLPPTQRIAAGQDEDEALLRRLTVQQYSETELEACLGAVGRTLASGPHTSKPGSVAFCTRGRFSAAQRREQAEAIGRAYRKGAKALRAEGFELGAPLPHILVVEIVSPGVHPMTVVDEENRVVLARSPSRLSSGPIPKLMEHEDGLPTLREVLQTSDLIRTRLWAGTAGAGAPGSAGSIENGLARLLLAQARPRIDGPRWLRVGLVAWIADRTRTAPRRSAFPCSTPLAAERFRAVLAPGAETRPIDAAGLGVIVGEVFGKTSAEIIGALVEADPTVKQDRLECPLCRGTSRLAMSCPDCLGLKVVPCTSCFGTNGCFASTCIKGWHHYTGSGKKVRCKFCGNRGTVKCIPCSNRGTVKCRACRSGRIGRPCLICKDGTIPRPENGPTSEMAAVCASPEAAGCVWCSGPVVRRACSTCGGAGFRGCSKCFGTTRRLCGKCGGTGEKRMVYTDGSVASATKCPTCSGAGYKKCTECDRGKCHCVPCDGKGLVVQKRKDCPACEGERPNLARCAERLRERLGRPDAQEAELNKRMLEKAVSFLMTCRADNGAFALRVQRKSKSAALGRLLGSGLFANADTLWTLASVGIDRNDRRVSRAWDVLCTQSSDIISARNKKMTTQGAAQALRALVSGGEEPDGPLVTGLIKVLVDAQAKNGLWPKPLTGRDGRAFDALFALESLRIAGRKGARVPSVVWGKALRGANSSFTLANVRGMGDWLSATNVASSTALIIIAKAGTLGKRAIGFNYRGIPQVQAGLQWLDRYFDVRHEPVFVKGARRRKTTDSGYSAYIFAIQRLAMLLNIEELGGEHWHTTGARHLRSIQFPDGSFEETSRGAINGPVRTTTSAVLFLVRATPPITR